MWSPKRMTLLWFSGVCEGYLFLNLIKSLQFQGWGWFSNFRGFSWLWVLWLSNQLILSQHGFWVIVWGGGGDGFSN